MRDWNVECTIDQVGVLLPCAEPPLDVGGFKTLSVWTWIVSSCDGRVQGTLLISKTHRSRLYPETGIIIGRYVTTLTKTAMIS